MRTEHALLPRKTLANTGIELTVFGVGGYLGLLPDEHAPRVVCEQAAVLAVRRAVELGVGYFDTAPSYGGGEAERHLGLGGPTPRFGLLPTVGGFSGRCKYQKTIIGWFNDFLTTYFDANPVTQRVQPV